MDISVWMVHEALALLRESVPIGLGESRLAKLLFPVESDRLTRGALTRRILVQAIESLKVYGPPLDPRWRPYRICTALYLDGRTREEICATLAISNTTYSRAKQRAVRWIIAYLPYLLDERVRMVGE